MQRVLDGNVERNIRNDFDKILVKGFYDRILKKRKIPIEIKNFVNVSRNIIFKKTFIIINNFVLFPLPLRFNKRKQSVQSLLNKCVRGQRKKST